MEFTEAHPDWFILIGCCVFAFGKRCPIKFTQCAEGRLMERAVVHTVAFFIRRHQRLSHTKPRDIEKQSKTKEEELLESSSFEEKGLVRRS